MSGYGLEGISVEEMDRIFKEHQEEYYEACRDYGARSDEAKELRKLCMEISKEASELYGIVYLA